ncbi:MAG: cytochrome bd-I oxidase subunit CydX [Proteobacteria bacterium]|nr:cytochrome bd-I oxidase subunit CydX [Pseudomonadota bacterium]
MWYFAWVLGIGFAVLLAILNAMWGENEEARQLIQPASHTPSREEADA